MARQLLRGLCFYSSLIITALRDLIIFIREQRKLLYDNNGEKNVIIIVITVDIRTQTYRKIFAETYSVFRMVRQRNVQM